jgi:hypothetical protein
VPEQRVFEDQGDINFPQISMGKIWKYNGQMLEILPIPRSDSSSLCLWLYNGHLLPACQVCLKNALIGWA